MTISDIFDALTASDRPYKAAVPVDRALDILGFERKAGAVDGDLLDLFIAVKPWEQPASLTRRPRPARASAAHAAISASSSAHVAAHATSATPPSQGSSRARIAI